MAFTFTQLAFDSFQRVNEDPLGPNTVWDGFFDMTPVTGDHAVINNNECEINVTSNADGGASNLTALPSDQWVEVELNNLNKGAVFLYLRSGGGVTHEPVPNYNLSISQNFNDSNSFFSVSQIDSSGGTVVHTWITSQKQIFRKGDKLRFIVAGDHVSGRLYVQLNGLLLAVLNLSDSPVFLSSGKTAFQLAAVQGAQTPTNVGIVNFKAGGVSGSPAYSVPDCRVPPNGPNAARIVQDTLVYDVQTSDNPVIPSKDSRALGAPVDSRTIGIIPQNSRTSGAIGPGE